MRYQRSMEIEQRLDAVLELIRSGSYSTPALAEKLGVSVPTISRSVEALRERGYNIQAISSPVCPAIASGAFSEYESSIIEEIIWGNENYL